MASIWKRPLDLLFVFMFASFATIGITIDLIQSTYGAVLEQEKVEYGAWPPAVVVDVYVWWCSNYDFLLGHNPVWFETLAWVSPFIYTPFYFVAIYAFICEKEWIRIPALMWSWGMFLVLLACIREQLVGPHKTNNVPVILAAYGGYIAAPLLLMVRMAASPVFASSSSSSSSSSSKQKSS